MNARIRRITRAEALSKPPNQWRAEIFWSDAMKPGHLWRDVDHVEEVSKDELDALNVDPNVFVMVVHSCAPLVWTYPVEGRHIVTYVSAGDPEDVPVKAGDMITDGRRDDLAAAGFDVREDISPVIRKRAS